MDLAELRTKASLYLETKANRLAADKRAATIKADEDKLKQEIITACRENKGGFDLASHVIEYIVKVKPSAEDWSQIRAYVVANDAADLMQARLHEGAVKARWEDDVEIPGVGRREVEDIKIGVRSA